MATNLLSAAECKNATSNGAGVRKLHDGDGLYLWVYLDGRKYWRMRYKQLHTWVEHHASDVKRRLESNIPYPWQTSD